MSTIQDLSNFDKLPDAAHVDVHVVAALFGCKTPTVWARLRRKELPAPRKFGAHTRWNVGDLRGALAAGSACASPVSASNTCGAEA